MHLYKRKDSKFWWYKFVLDGVAYQCSTKTRNRRDAEGIASKARLSAIEGKYDIKRQKATPLLKDAVDRFLKQVDHPKTAARYASSCRIFSEFFGVKKLHQITPDEIEKFKEWRLSEGKMRPGKDSSQIATGKPAKPSTVNGDLACLSALYEYFVQLEVVQVNPVSRVKFLSLDNNKTRILDFEEERLYLAACGDPLRDIAAVMIDTGIRPGEAFELRRENVDLATGYVFIPKGKSKAARRRISLTRRAAGILGARLAAANGEMIFPGVTRNNADWQHQAALKTSGVEYFTLHALRHTFATRAVAAGVDLVTLKTLLGHSRLEMVLRYAHPTAGHQAQAIQKLEEFAIQKQMEEAATAGVVM